MPQKVVYESPALFLPDVVEVVLRIGVVRSQDHLQAQLEVRSSTDDTLLALDSWPHVDMRRWSAHERMIVAKLMSSVAMVTGPF